MESERKRGGERWRERERGRAWAAESLSRPPLPRYPSPRVPVPFPPIFPPTPFLHIRPYGPQLMSGLVQALRDMGPSLQAHLDV